MKILLLGEYSNVHWTLAEGLRQLGHMVTVVSNGDFWKNYQRDINLTRTYTKLGSISYMIKLYSLLPRLRGYDVVQIINPICLEIKAQRILPIYQYLRKHNKKMFMGAFGMDYYWVHTCCTDMPLEYSDFNMGKELRQTTDALKEQRDWLGTEKQRLNEYMAHDCDGIIAGLYEYWVCYHAHFPDKTTFIPFPIRTKTMRERQPMTNGDHRLKLFIGINRERSIYKGTDIMLKAAQDLVLKYPHQVSLQVAESVPFEQYQRMMNGADVILDQLYSYTPAMNALEAMSKGIVCVGGGEPENYQLLHEDTLRPIVNVKPCYESVYHELESLILHPERLSVLQQQSIAYIQKHHDYVKVAQQYVDFYNSSEPVAKKKE